MLQAIAELIREKSAAGLILAPEEILGHLIDRGTFPGGPGSAQQRPKRDAS